MHFNPPFDAFPDRVGRFIVAEGIDGAGKTDLIQSLATTLTADGYSVVTTAEPYETEAGQKIRAAYEAGQVVDPREELRLFAQDRRQHVHSVILPALYAGQVVLCDRYAISGVYQVAKGVNFGKLMQYNTDFPKPDITLLLDLDAETAMSRLTQRGKLTTVENLDNLRRVRALYIKHLMFHGSRVSKIDARQTPRMVYNDALLAVRHIIKGMANRLDTRPAMSAV